ncbi:FMN-dependent L-lactate dehydrogenase LldD [Sphingomonas sp. AR_OL41]|uniref:FMN-dependent L-lactate dehydrogenase LldD n=1 Tax=Sphingomonas sp. AR_OL41 TaxID=3042729 RepID=UPI002480F002|nr:FMN-dependent L-lactate dehydrogenase LldD [Sphingomonas sp. AR_OL41]MDH7973915.1 FMN-dependent L-lactate dehydrogenase LldD [Sphingomonas sp. AR_OL41]
MIISSPLDFREAARRRLPRFLFDYVDGGAQDETTLLRNRRDLGAVDLRQRVLQDVSSLSLRTTLFEEDLAMPLVLGPVGIAGMLARRGEVQAARAARAAGIPMCLSTVSICDVGEVAQRAGGSIWFQLYVIRDRGFMRDLLAAAKAAQCTALVFTVDMMVPGIRYRDARSGMSGRHARLRRMAQAIAHPRWAADVGLCGRPHKLGNLAPVLGGRSGLGDYMGWLAANFDPGVTWDDLGWIRGMWDGPLIIKGILDPRDAREARALGADGIVVSNHGGRQLDGAPSTASVLPAIADEIGCALKILVDSGVRSGLDVVRMLALGADGVLLGRAWAFALAARGEAGVAALLAMIEREIRVVMALTGVTDIAQVDRNILAAGDRHED